MSEHPSINSWDTSKDSPLPAGLVWWAQVDGRWQVEVHRAENGAHLCIYDRQKAMQLALREPVALAYGAIFGPDVEDVNGWMDRAEEFIDAS